VDSTKQVFNWFQSKQLFINQAIQIEIMITRWRYFVECPRYSIWLEALGYLCTSCLLPAFD